MALIGYARVSTPDQCLDLQIDALEQAGCSKIFHDIGQSGAKRSRPGFDDAIAALVEGDTFVVWRMDRAFRSLKHAVDVLEDFEGRGVQLRCLSEGIDTSTPMGKCMYQVCVAFAELERSIIRERTVAGMEAARRRGVHIGRPRKAA